MRTIPYSASKDDLLRPWMRGNYFSGNEAQTTAGLCAELSRLAYARKPPSRSFDQDLIASVLKRIGFSRASFFESAIFPGGTHCFTAVGRVEGEPVGVVVFRGTDADDPTDIGDDVDFILRHWPPGGLVHTGFAKALDEIESGLGPVVRAMGCSILFTGHSLGAALATLAASLYREAAKDPALVIFGSPRVGNADFITTFAGIAVQRYVDCRDVVTRVPLRGMGYEHLAPLYYIDRDGQISVDPSDDAIHEDRDTAELDYLREYAWKHGNVGVRDLADHIAMNYVSAVSAASALSAAAHV